MSRAAEAPESSRSSRVGVSSSSGGGGGSSSVGYTSSKMGTTRAMAASSKGAISSVLGGASGTSTPAANLTAGSRCTIVQNIDVRGTVHVGSGTVIHPQAVIHALHPQGKIVIGQDNIIEELVHIIHHGPGTMTIGDKNLFEVGCRIEASSIGTHNTFECKSRVTSSVAIQDFTTVGVGCIAQPTLQWELETEEDVEDTQENKDETAKEQAASAPGEDGSAKEAKEEDVARRFFVFPSRTIIFGEESRSRIWSGNGVRQGDALHAKHLDHLRRNLPELHKLRMM